LKKIGLIVLFVLALSLAACGSTSNSGNSGSSNNPNTITMGASTFSANTISIPKGSTIAFVDDQTTGAEHILVTGKMGIFQSQPGAPDFGGSNGHTFQPGQAWTTPPLNTPGTYFVTCTIHPTTMNLMVTVTG